MNYLLDTCVISDYFKKKPSVIERFKKCSPHQIFISTITAMEIEYGLHLKPEREQKIRPLWNALVQEIQVLTFSKNCALAAAVVRTHLRKSGTPIGPYDVLIAGTATAHNLILVTSNGKEFKRVPALSLENWGIENPG